MLPEPSAELEEFSDGDFNFEKAPPGVIFPAWMQIGEKFPCFAYAQIPQTGTQNSGADEKFVFSAFVAVFSVKQGSVAVVLTEEMLYSAWAKIVAAQKIAVT